MHLLWYHGFQCTYGDDLCGERFCLKSKEVSKALVGAGMVMHVCNASIHKAGQKYLQLEASMGYTDSLNSYSYSFIFSIMGALYLFS
jgi:hypothetical protein